MATKGGMKLRTRCLEPKPYKYNFLKVSHALNACYNGNTLQVRKQTSNLCYQRRHKVELIELSVFSTTTTTPTAVDDDFRLRTREKGDDRESRKDSKSSSQAIPKDGFVQYNVV